MHTVAVYSSRGGCGKSAATVFLAELLASSLHKKRLLVVDLDPQQTSSTALLGEPLRVDAQSAKRTADELIRVATGGAGFDPVAVRKYLTTRPARGVGKPNILGAVTVLPSDRERWHDLNDELAAPPPRPTTSSNPALQNGLLGGKSIPEPCGARRGPVLPLPAYARALRHVLQHVREDYDVCLIDFPSHGRGPLVQIGLWAADWWLFPVQPNRAGAADIDSTRTAVWKAFRGHRSLRPLGTLLQMWRQRTETAYRRARRMLVALAERNFIPKLFDKDSEVGDSTDARKALDETLPANTLRQKFGDKDSAFCRAVRRLAVEVLLRLEKSAVPAEVVSSREEVNRQVTAAWAEA